MANSYSCHAVLIKPVQKLFHNLGNENQPRDVGEIPVSLNHRSSDSWCACQYLVECGMKNKSQARCKTVRRHTMCEGLRRSEKIHEVTRTVVELKSRDTG